MFSTNLGENHLSQSQSGPGHLRPCSPWRSASPARQVCPQTGLAARSWQESRGLQSEEVWHAGQTDSWLTASPSSESWRSRPHPGAARQQPKAVEQVRRGGGGGDSRQLLCLSWRLLSGHKEKQAVPSEDPAPAAIFQRLRDFTDSSQASSSLSTTPPPTCPPAPPPSVKASPPPPPTVPAQPPAPAPAPQSAQPPLLHSPPPPIRDEFYPYGEGRIVAQQPGYPVVSYQPPYWPPPSPYHSYPGPALPPHTLHSVTPAFAWPSHLPSSGQQLRGGGRQDDQRFQLGPQQSSQAYYAPLHLQWDPSKISQCESDQ